MPKITIVGAGMAGLLAANMLRNHEVKLIEAAPALPNNHSAVLRFRSSVVSDTLGIPFERVRVSKGSVLWKNPIADSMAYSRKTNGTYRSDRSIVTTNNELVDRFIAPPNLISQMAERVQNIEFKKKFKKSKSEGPAIISTMPMPALMELLGYRYELNFGTVHGFNVSATIPNTYAHFSLYVPHPEIAFNRISMTGDQLIIEYSYPFQSAEQVKELASEIEKDKATLRGNIGLALEMCGISRNMSNAVIGEKVSLQKYSKILPVNEDERKAFISWASEFHNIYSLGRFAVWKPGLLLDDLVQDVRIIEGFINKPHKYAQRKHWA